MIKYFQKKAILKRLGGKRTPFYKSFADIHSIAFLIDFDQLKEMEEVALQLKKEGKKVTVYAIATTQQISLSKESIIESRKIIDAKNFSWMGEPNSSTIKEFSEKQYDAIVDISKNDIRLQHLLLSNSCTFRIGTKSLDYPLYDFTLVTDSMDLKDICQEIKKYLSNIRPSTINS